MRVIIYIPEEDYIRIKDECDKSVDNDPDTFIKHPYLKRSDFYPVYLIGNGIPVPNGHGRLIDERQITECKQVGLIIRDGIVTRCLATDAPTILDADRWR